MCCDPQGYDPEEANGVCEECGGLTVDGDAVECCGYSPLDCETCGARYCDGSC